MDEPAAYTLAERLLAGAMPVRWGHVKQVAAKARILSAELDLNAQRLVPAALLHDVGYSPAVLATGFHPLDGARYLRGIGVEDEVTSLVANHSCAHVEAGLRGLASELATEFPSLDPELADALCFADMTTGPDGSTLTVRARLAEIRSRYGPGHVVTEFVDHAEEEIVASAERILRRLSPAQSR
jgi:putative nucleotidyltransferase with HDIG domain